MKNILILAVLSAVILTGCGNISPPFKAEGRTPLRIPQIFSLLTKPGTALPCLIP